jgi:cytochrome b6-f complex iron-sulfur subunit
MPATILALSSGVVFGIGAAVIGVFAIVFILAMLGRRDRDSALGFLSRETRRRDKSAKPLEPVSPAGPSPVTGRDVERSVALERRETSVVTRPKAAPPVPAGPVDLEAFGVTRRQFLNRGIVNMFALGLAGFGAACIAFLWPSLSGGFGSTIKVSQKLSDILQTLISTKAPVYIPEGRMYLQPYPKDAIPKAQHVAAYAAIIPGMEAGIVALYQKCVHLGCRVPWCQSSQWFECPCHGSKYNRVGEKKGGPAPRGLDRFVVSVSGDSISVDTKLIIQGPPIGTDTTGQGQEGPHCA